MFGLAAAPDTAIAMPSLTTPSDASAPRSPYADVGRYSPRDDSLAVCRVCATGIAGVSNPQWRGVNTKLAALRSARRAPCP